MRFYTVPTWIKLLWPGLIWTGPVRDGHKTLYLTFDDGPTEEYTDWILDTLKTYDARATFFCVGENVQRRPDKFRQLLDEGHSVGNHTHNHLNATRTPASQYLENTARAAQYINSKLFRPPYGRMKPRLARSLKRQGYEVVMWSLISYDFDHSSDVEHSWRVLKRSVRPGSIIVFHDNIKAIDNLKILLPRTLEHFASEGYRFEKL